MDGRRLPGSLTRFLPIYETFCTRTGPLADSEIDLRVLRDGPPQNGVRILGQTVRVTGTYPSYRWETLTAATVEIRGETGAVAVHSDEHGIYDVKGLPPGYYEVARQPAAGTLPSWRDTVCRWKVAEGDIRDCTVPIR